MFRAAIAEGTPLREAGRAATPRRRPSSPTKLTVSLIRERLSQDDASAGFALDGFPRNLVQARALDEDAARDRPWPRRDPLLLRPSGQRRDGARAPAARKIEGRPDDTPDVIARRLGRTTPRPSRWSSTTGRPASSCRCTPRRASRRSGARSRTRCGRSRRRMIIRKSQHEIETMARAGQVVADTLALLEEHIQPGITTGELDALARGVHPVARRRTDVQGLPGLPGGDVPLAERHDRPRHPRPDDARRRATSSRSTSV